MPNSDLWSCLDDVLTQAGARRTDTKCIGVPSFSRDARKIPISQKICSRNWRDSKSKWECSSTNALIHCDCAGTSTGTCNSYSIQPRVSDTQIDDLVVLFSTLAGLCSGGSKGVQAFLSFGNIASCPSLASSKYEEMHAELKRSEAELLPCKSSTTAAAWMSRSCEKTGHCGPSSSIDHCRRVR